MSKNTSVSLGNYFEEFIRSRLKTGRYKNVSEVIRAALRLLEEEENKVVVLKNAVQEGIDSGHVNNFNAENHLRELKDKKRVNG
ncbi:MAG: type II toxin-antitoxin system ParD family antitoxin [Bacteroidales bacterium]|nr:type II toxin-antitoxin system ParD family antitoxin [Bacteroidales bacterium]